MSETLALRALNNHVQHFLRGMVEGLNDEQIRYSAPAIDGRSIAGVVVHAYSSPLLFSNIITGKGWSRSDIPGMPETSADLLALIDNIHDQLDQILVDLPAGALAQKYKMPWGHEMEGMEAFSGALAHSLVHIGNIQGIRAIGGFPTPPETY